MTRRLVLLGLFVAGLLIALRTSRTPHERATAPPAGSAEREARSPDLATPAPAPSSPPGRVALEAEERPARSAAPPAGAAARLRLRGRLRWSGDGRGAAGVQLTFHFRDGATSALTGADGAFETEPVLTGGIVRASPTLEEPGPPGAEPPQLAQSGFVVPEAARAQGVHEIELVLLEPNAWVRVQVVQDGHAVPARVRWSGNAAIGTGTTKTDLTGFAEIALSSVQPGDRVRLEASAEQAESDALVLAHPWGPETVRLELFPTGRIDARVVDADGRPLAGRSVRVGEAWALSDADGRAQLEVRAGSTKVGLREEHEWLRRTVVVPAGGVVAVELVSPSLLVAAGRVVSEKDEPLEGVPVGAEAPGLLAGARTAEDGRFEIRAPLPVPLGPVRVSAGGGVDEARFDPGEALVPLGTRELLFRRLAGFEPLELAVAVLDARTGLFLERAVVELWRSAAPLAGEVDSSRDGLFTCSIRPHDDLCLRARAVGFRERALGWTELSPAERAGEPLQLALEPGFELVVSVRASDTREPIAGALVLAGETPLAASDARGQARLESASWPASLRAEAPGFAARELAARELLFDPVFWLARR